MTDFALARALHVLAVVLWIGGVGMVTMVLLPAIRRSYPPPQRFGVFHAMEQRFATQSRFTTALAGASGFYMMWWLDAWDRFATASFWWMHAMVLTWAVFTVMLFVAEPLFLERILARCAGGDVPADRVAASGVAGAEPADDRGCRRRKPWREPVRVVRGACRCGWAKPYGAGIGRSGAGLHIVRRDRVWPP
jgi:uncharacterized membrane protein